MEMPLGQNQGQGQGCLVQPVAVLATALGLLPGTATAPGQHWQRSARLTVANWVRVWTNWQVLMAGLLVELGVVWPPEQGELHLAGGWLG